MRPMGGTTTTVVTGRTTALPPCPNCSHILPQSRFGRLLTGALHPAQSSRAITTSLATTAPTGTLSETRFWRFTGGSRTANRFAQMGNPICPNGQIDLPKWANQYQILYQILTQIYIKNIKGPQPPSSSSRQFLRCETTAERRATKSTQRHLWTTTSPRAGELGRPQ